MNLRRKEMRVELASLLVVFKRAKKSKPSSTDGPAGISRLRIVLSKSDVFDRDLH